jgi:hypothetical protein
MNGYIDIESSQRTGMPIVKHYLDDFQKMGVSSRLHELFMRDCFSELNDKHGDMDILTTTVEDNMVNSLSCVKTRKGMKYYMFTIKGDVYKAAIHGQRVMFENKQIAKNIKQSSLAMLKKWKSRQTWKLE